MILQALHQLARRENLLTDPDYEPKPVAWLVRVSPEGKLLKIEDTRTTPQSEGRRARKPVPARFMVPRQEIVTSGDRAHFLCHKAEYVFGIDPDGKRSREKLRKRFSLFRNAIKACVEATGDDGAAAVHRMLEDVAEGRQDVELPDDCAGNDLFAFVYQPDIDRLVSDREVVRAYWKDQRETNLPTGRTSRCLVSGEPVAEPANFPQIKKVPGKGTSSGISLVSFNKHAFESFGWKRNENAQISRNAAEACSTALNRLLDPGYPDPRQPGQAMPRRSMRISADTVVCYWSARKSGDEFCGIFAGLLEGNPEEVGNVFRSIWAGRIVDLDDPSAFYALTLTGQQGRAIVRDWFESTVADVARNLADHFRDLDIVRSARKRDDPGTLPHGMRTLMEAIAQPSERRSEGVPSHLGAQFVRSALSGTPYPLACLQRAVIRFRAEIGRELQQERSWQARQWNEARAALIKAVLNRRIRAGISQFSEEVNATMDPDNRSEGYVLGQLMAVFERLQQLAVGDPNASVIDRFFSGASASPRAVFVRLYKNARHHARKARDGGSAGLSFRLERLIDELSDRFGLSARAVYPHRNSLPSYLDQEQQGLFVLGYHQMRRWLWMNREERAAWEAGHHDVPGVFLWGVRGESTVDSETLVEPSE